MARPRGRTLPIRISVALSPAQFEAVSTIAEEQASSVSWVVRRAVAEYVSRSGPLANGSLRGGKENVAKKSDRRPC